MSEITFTPKDVVEWQKGDGLSEEHTQELFEWLGVSRPAQEHKDWLAAVAQKYRLTSAVASGLEPTAQEQRIAVSGILNAATKMERALRNLNLPATDEGDKIREAAAKIAIGDLQELQEACDQALPRIRRSGPQTKIDRENFVCELASIYEASTGNQPTRSKDKYNEPNGVFHNFVLAILNALGSTETHGIDDVIKRVVKRRG